MTDALAAYNDLDEAEKIQFMIEVYCPGIHTLEWLSITTSSFRPTFWARYNLLRCRFERFDPDLKGIFITKKSNDVDKKPIIGGMVLTGFDMTGIYMPMEDGSTWSMLLHHIKFDNMWHMIEEWLEL